MNLNVTSHELIIIDEWNIPCLFRNTIREWPWNVVLLCFVPCVECIHRGINFTKTTIP